ncbi:hypothetical protein LUZ60_014576 [Juncus effusus]|nr:hypothetical protein LUZ60_014576 [Juncus effusus]
MATALSAAALPFVAGGNLGFRRESRRVSQGIKAVPPLLSCSRINAGFRFMNVAKLRKMHRGPIFASETNPSERNENKPTDSPPLTTILAGIVVFLLFAWLLGSIALWIFSLIVNVPKS